MPTSASVSTMVPAVLIVDDDDDIRLAIAMLLEDAGYRYAEAATPAQVFERLRDASTPPYVVLLDYLLSCCGDGEALLRTIQQDSALCRHRYVLVTASQSSRFSDEERRLIGEICTEVVAKPFDIDCLLEAVARTAARLPRTS